MPPSSAKPGYKHTAHAMTRFFIMHTLNSRHSPCQLSHSVNETRPVQSSNRPHQILQQTHVLLSTSRYFVHEETINRPMKTYMVIFPSRPTVHFTCPWTHLPPSRAFLHQPTSPVALSVSIAALLHQRQLHKTTFSHLCIHGC